MKATPLLVSTPTRIRYGGLKEQLQGPKQAQSNLMDALTELMEVDDDDRRLNAYNKDRHETEERFNKALEMAMEAIGEHEHTFEDAGKAGPRAAVAAAAAAAAKVKIQDSLGPFILTKEHDPTEVRAWLRQVDNYFPASNLQVAALKEQQAHFFKYVDFNLIAPFEGNIGPATEVIGGPDSCIGLLKRDRDRRYPPFNRRHMLFKIEQHKGEAFSDMDVRLRQAADEAAFERLNADELYVQLQLMATKDVRLKTKFLEINAPTAEEIRDVARAYESASLGTAAGGGGDGFVNSIKHQGGGGGGKSANPAP